jgi:Glycosyltransferase family 87
VTFALTASAVMLAWPGDSPLVPRHGGHPTGDRTWAWIFLGLLAAAFVAYVAGVMFARIGPPRLAVVAAIACAVQLVPLGAPLLLSTDAWAYWAYGRIAAVHDANPYRDAPQDFPRDPALRFVGTDWRDSTTVYGPAFTLASEPIARAAGSSSDAAAWIYKSFAAVAILAAAGLAARLSRRPALALAFVGWNPVVAVHFGGGGHNDALLALLVVGALAAGAVGRRQLAGVCWALGVFVKWVPLVLLPLRALEARAHRRAVGHTGFALAAAVLAGLAVLRYGTGWLHAFGPLARNANRETAWSLPHRVEQLGIPHGVSIALFAVAFALAYAWLVREAWRGRARLGLATCALLLAVPYLVVWYVVLALPLAAAEDDEPAALLSLALCAYLLRQTIPL